MASGDCSGVSKGDRQAGEIDNKRGAEERATGRREGRGFGVSCHERKPARTSVKLWKLHKGRN